MKKVLKGGQSVSDDIYTLKANKKNSEVNLDRLSIQSRVKITPETPLMDVPQKLKINENPIPHVLTT